MLRSRQFLERDGPAPMGSGIFDLAHRKRVKNYNVVCPTSSMVGAELKTPETWRICWDGGARTSPSHMALAGYNYVTRGVKYWRRSRTHPATMVQPRATPAAQQLLDKET